MSQATGRPLKYRFLLDALEDDAVYSPASIVNLGVSRRLLPHYEDPKEQHAQRVRIRHTLARFAKNHGFPETGDGTVSLPGQALSQGWRGARWKAAMPPPRRAVAEAEALDVLPV